MPTTCAAWTARHAAASTLARAEEVAGKARKTYLEAIDKAVNALDRRAELLELVAGYRRLKADLGLMDFGDQIALAARLVAQQPDVGVVERGRFKVVLLDEYQDTSVAQATMLARLFSGPDPESGPGTPGDGRRRPQPGDLRLARARRSPTSSTSPTPSRPPTASPADCR